MLGQVSDEVTSAAIAIPQDVPFLLRLGLYVRKAAAAVTNEEWRGRIQKAEESEVSSRELCVSWQLHTES